MRERAKNLNSTSDLTIMLVEDECLVDCTVEEGHEWADPVPSLLQSIPVGF